MESDLVGAKKDINWLPHSIGLNLEQCEIRNEIIVNFYCSFEVGKTQFLHYEKKGETIPHTSF